MQAEIDKYKRETEEAVARTVAEMKAALEERLKEKIQLENDNDRLEALVAHLQGQVNELQAQVCLSVCLSESQFAGRRFPGTALSRNVTPTPPQHTMHSVAASTVGRRTPCSGRNNATTSPTSRDLDHGGRK